MIFYKRLWHFISVNSESDNNSLFDRRSIGEMALWVKGKTSKHIGVLENRVQRIFAIEAKTSQVEGNWIGEKYDVDRECQILRLHLLAFRKYAVTESTSSFSVIILRGKSVNFQQRPSLLNLLAFRSALLNQ